MMAKKNRLEKLLSSIFRTHIDPENSELLENSEDIENKFKKILELINGEESDANPSANLLELISHLRNFANGYQALYGRYDHLVGKLKKKVHHKRGEHESFSFNFSPSDSDSDSESEDFSNRANSEELQGLHERHENREKRSNELEAAIDEKKEALRSENLKLTNKIVELEKALTVAKAEADLNLKLVTEDLSSKNADLMSDNENLKYRLETAEQNRAELAQRLEALAEKNGALNSEILSQTSQINEGKMAVENLTAASELLTHENSKLLNRIDELSHQLKAKGDSYCGLELKHTEAEGKIMELEKRLELLSEENFILQQSESKLLEAKKIIDDFRAETELLKGGNSKLHNEVDNLILKLEAANLQVTDLNKEIEVVGQQKGELASELQQAAANVERVEYELQRLREEKSMLQQNNTDLHDQNSDLGRRLEEARAKVLGLQEKLEAVLSAEAGKIQEMAMHEKDLQNELELLHVQKGKLVEQMNTIRDLVSDKEISMKKLEDTLTSKIFHQDTMLDDLKCSFDELLVRCKRLKDQFHESCTNLKAAELVCKEQSEEMSNLLKNHNEAVKKLAVCEAEKMDAYKEVENLYQQVQRQEVQVRLLSQKLKITETESREKEENHKGIIQVLKEKGRALEEQSQMLLGKVKSLVENDLTQMKEAVQMRSSNLRKGFQNLESFFEQNRIQFLTRISECIDEVKFLRTMSEQQLHERECLENEMQELEAKLQKKEAHMDLLKVQVGNLKTMLASKEEEQGKQMADMLLFQKKILELEERMKEKEVEILARDEEKKEAIRQLCFFIEYHRENSNNLLRHLSAMHKRRWHLF